MKPFITAALFYLLAGTDAARPQENQATLEHAVPCTYWDSSVVKGTLCNILKVVEHANNSPAINCLHEHGPEMRKMMQRFIGKTFFLSSQRRLDLLRHYRFVSPEFSDNVTSTFQSECEKHFIETVHNDWISANIEKYPELKDIPPQPQIKNIKNVLIRQFCSKDDPLLKIERKESVTHVIKAKKSSSKSDSDKLSHPDNTEDDTTRECTEECTEECGLDEPQNSSTQPSQRYKISPNSMYISAVVDTQYIILTMGKVQAIETLYKEKFNKVKEYFIKQLPQWYERREKMFIDMVRTELKYC